MANGGITPFDGEGDAIEGSQSGKSEELVRYVHTHTPRQTVVRAYQVTALRGVPGVARKSTRGKKTRCDYFDEANDVFPFLFCRIPQSDNYCKLDIDLTKFGRLICKYGASRFGTFPEWGDFWGLKEDLCNCAAANAERDLDDYESPHFEVVDTLLERVDIAALMKYAEDNIDRRQEDLRAHIRRLKADGVREGDYTAIPVQYSRHAQLGGRRYAKGMAAQKTTREARTVAFGDSAVDVDIANSTPSILLNLLRELAPLDNYPMLQKYCNHYGSWRAFLADYQEIQQRGAKKSIIKLFYGGKPDVELPFLWALGTEVSRATDEILAAVKFRYLQDHFRGRRDPRASRLSYAAAA